MKILNKTVTIGLILSLLSLHILAQIPRIVEKDGRHALLVDGKPFFILDGHPQLQRLARNDARTFFSCKDNAS